MTIMTDFDMRSVPDYCRITPVNDGLDYLIGGQVLTWKGPNAPVYSPIGKSSLKDQDGVYLGAVAQLGPEEAIRALSSARIAYRDGAGRWPLMTASQRISALECFLEMLRELEEPFVRMEMWEIAKPYSACRDEFERTIKYIEDSIAYLESNLNSSARISRSGAYVSVLRRTPLGVALCLGPFNYPLNETFAMVIPALLMGNAVVIKPPRYGCLCSMMLSDAFAAAFPPGVVNVIYGEGESIIDPLMSRGDVEILAFIGSAEVANHLVSLHPRPNRLTTVLGLEAKNPAFVFADADLELAAQECLDGAMEYNGQRCTAIKQVLVHQDVVERFVEIISEKADRLVCGMPWEDGVVITPLPGKDRAEWLQELLDDAVSLGARVSNQRSGLGPGTLWYPTILFPVNLEMKIAQVEQFGPVLPIGVFTGQSELVDYMRHSKYGQQASIFSQNPQSCARFIDVLANMVARINLNSQCRRSPDELPFTGRKDSAEGTLSVGEALKTFSLPSLVTANPKGQALFWDIFKSNQSQFVRM